MFIHSDGLNRMLTPLFYGTGCVWSGPSGIDPRSSKAIGSSDNTTKTINIWIFTAQTLCFQSSSGSFSWKKSMGFQNVGLGGATGVARSDCARWEGFSLGARQPYLWHLGPSARGHHGNHLQRSGRGAGERAAMGSSKHLGLRDGRGVFKFYHHLYIGVL
jgi:hypothetical protein